ncbi:hypothetical protein [Telmatospirillum siberiense]|uniref:Type IV secretion system protein n=1 Tax=Telmatospirillum siberiense TaxID=382514 RepID=A0A2N3Q0X6_9PROT|nr:hypothetical protein [Telmatospirillum siberiense]PKU26309.1 hypothetical protein CWS72_00165 [Telmatospirillum siberiense]
MTGPSVRSVGWLIAVLSWSAPAMASDVEDLYGRLAGGCWACDVLLQSGTIGLDLAQQTFDAVAGQLASLLGMLMALWLLFLAGRIFLPFGPGEAPAALGNRGARKLAALALVLGFLQSSQLLWDYLFMPVFSTGTSLAVLLLSLSTGQSCPVVSIAPGIAGAEAALDGMRCPLSLIQDVFTRGMLTGVAMIMGAAWHSWLDFLKFWSWPAQILQMLSGVLMALVYAFGFLMFPLFFLDAVLRAAIITILAPFAAAFSLFSPTRKMTEKALWGLIQVALTMVFSAVATGLAVQGLAGIYATLPTSDGVPPAGWPELIAALEAGRLQLSLAQRSYWTMLGMGVMALFMIRAAADMASALCGVSAGNFTGATAALAEMAGGGVTVAVKTVRLGWQVVQIPLAYPARGASHLARAATGPVRQAIGKAIKRMTGRDGVSLRESSLAEKVSGLAAGRGEGRGA